MFASLSDNQIREKILKYLKQQGEATTRHIFYSLSTVASESKVKEILNSMLDEEEVFMRKQLRGKVTTYYWSIDGSGIPENPPLTMKEMNKIMHSAKVESDETENVEHKPQKISEKLADIHIKATLKHEYEIILRKQQRRKDFASKVLQNAEATIQFLEQQIKEL